MNLAVRETAFEATKVHFIKFETISMQAISLLFLDSSAENWPKELSSRICKHCIRIVYKWSKVRFQKFTLRDAQEFWY